MSAVSQLGYSAVFVLEPEEMHRCTHAIIPGVGNFQQGISYLEQSGIADAVHEFKSQGKPLLGICLGMQLLFDYSEEACLKTRGLSLIPGGVEKIKKLSQQIKIPHMGWNEISHLKKSEITEGIPDKALFYFCHSFAVKPESSDRIISNTLHGVEIPSIVNSGLVYGVQFHPEKSSIQGQRILKNFLEIK